MNKAQRRAITKLWLRCAEPGVANKLGSLRSFHRKATYAIGLDGVVLIYWCGMWCAIETDGYTHT